VGFDREPDDRDHNDAHVARDEEAEDRLERSRGSFLLRPRRRLDAVRHILFSVLTDVSRLTMKKPNQSPEPTPPLVTIRADARLAPSGVVAHL